MICETALSFVIGIIVIRLTQNMGKFMANGAYGHRSGIIRRAFLFGRYSIVGYIYSIDGIRCI